MILGMAFMYTKEQKSEHKITLVSGKHFIQRLVFRFLTAFEININQVKNKLFFLHGIFVT
jgi:hypothetical protein